MYSDRRFTYEEAQEILENKEGEFAEEILALNKVSTLLREKDSAPGQFPLKQRR